MAPSVITIVPTTAGPMPPSSLRVENGMSPVRKSHEKTFRPCWVMYTTTSVNGTSATTNDNTISTVASALLNRRRPVPGREPSNGVSVGDGGGVGVGGGAVAVVTFHPESLVRAPYHGAGDRTDHDREPEQHDTETDERRTLDTARLAELIGDDARHRVAGTKDVGRERLRRTDHQRYRDRLTDGTAEADDHGRDNTAATVRKHRAANHLPPRRAHRERRLLL